MIRADLGKPYEVVFSTRVGGVSDGVFSSLNLGLLSGDDAARVEENRRLLCAAMTANPARLTHNRQVHGAAVHRAVAGARGVEGDALWTDEPDLPVLAMTADCVPVALTRRNGGAPALAVVHAGWRGILAGVLEAAVGAVGGSPAAIVGPAIGVCCYEVGDEVARPYRERFGAAVMRGRNLDLRRAAEVALHGAGCEQVENIDLCTSCHPELFFSHRRDGARTGRQGVIGLVRAG